MAFVNRIRLPFKLTRPQYPETRSVYPKADGSIKTLSVIIRNSYEGETDYWPEKWHKRFAIAMGHDNIIIEGDKYLGGVSKDGDYVIDWPTFLDYPTGKAKFSVFVTPFDGTNSNCMTCEQATQVSLADDAFPDPLDENTTYTTHVDTNDNICCYPAVFSITTFNAAYLDSATIDQAGQITIHLKSGLIAINGLKLLTYRVTCPNGGYDEADVFADVNGTTPGCLAPSGLIVSSVTTTGCSVAWTAPTPAPDHYRYEIYKASDPGTLIQSNDTFNTILLIGGLEPGTDYIIYVRSQCDTDDSDGTASNYISAEFSTGNETSLCGQYRLVFDDPVGPPTAYVQVTYWDCAGNSQSQIVPNHSSRYVCALQTSPGSPVVMFAVGGGIGDLGELSYFNYFYNMPCP